MKVTFNTESVKYFEFVHGRKPRGVGQWAFSLHRDGASTVVFKTGSFTNARKEAMSEARGLGCTEVSLDT